MINRKLTLVCFLSFLILITGCTQQQQFKIASEKYRLNNGLEVILHTDKSDPISAVAIQYHVGSNREVPGRTGFAHLFEHMMFSGIPACRTGPVLQEHSIRRRDPQRWHKQRRHGLLRSCA